MKVQKIVEKGYIKIILADLPQYPEGTHFTGDCFNVSQKEMGEFFSKWEKIRNIHIGDFIYESAKHGHSFSEKDTPEWIAQTILDTYESFMKGYNNFIKQNTKSAEIITKQEAVLHLVAENNIYYRNSKGQITKLD